MIDDDIFDNDTIEEENNDEEHFQIQSAEKDDKYVLVNTRIDYQYRSEILNNMCLYDFVSILYKKKNECIRCKIFFENRRVSGKA